MGLVSCRRQVNQVFSMYRRCGIYLTASNLHTFRVIWIMRYLDSCYCGPGPCPGPVSLVLVPPAACEIFSSLHHLPVLIFWVRGAPLPVEAGCCRTSEGGAQSRELVATMVAIRPTARDPASFLHAATSFSSFFFLFGCSLRILPRGSKNGGTASPF